MTQETKERKMNLLSLSNLMRRYSKLGKSWEEAKFVS